MNRFYLCWSIDGFTDQVLIGTDYDQAIAYWQWVLDTAIENGGHMKYWLEARAS